MLGFDKAVRALNHSQRSADELAEDAVDAGGGGGGTVASKKKSFFGWSKNKSCASFRLYPTAPQVAPAECGPGD